MLLPGPESAISPSINRWPEKMKTQAYIKGEFDDATPMKVFTE
ncbi:MAG: hypothetical protein ACJAUP_002523 [Cellvibrionaceae bacterium]|jgi:hypothetical protein